jgi:hypothetical protein
LFSNLSSSSTSCLTNALILSSLSTSCLVSPCLKNIVEHYKTN